jgi:iron transport multicopper oxidase
MFDTVPPQLQPNVTATITYDTSAPLSNSTGEDTVENYNTVQDEELVPLIVSAQHCLLQAKLNIDVCLLT